MTYLTDEAAQTDPIELYEFTYGTSVWRYTDADADIIHPTTSDVYTAEPLSRGALHQSDEDGSMSLDVALDALNPVADFFRTPFLPSQQVWLTVYRTHVGSAAVATLFRGRVGQVIFENTTARLTCVPTRAAITKRIPVQLIQSLCNNTLYDGRCKANPALFTAAATINAITGLDLSVTWTVARDVSAGARPPGWYDGGYLSKAGVPAATIIEDTGSLLRILYNPGYVLGDAINVYAGCDKRYATCLAKFNNVVNHQGFPYFPTQDPFANEVL
jgi:uncharacterized phage protein (TIGR02218 family)